MGLDMVPMGKAKPGHEATFKKLYYELINFKEPKVSWLDKLIGKKDNTKEQLHEQWLAMQTSSFETLGAPMVGRDENANVWAKEQYEDTAKEISEADFLKKMDGHYVLELAEDSAGISKYVSNLYDRNVFRGQFLQECIPVIGEELVNEAWETKFAEEALDYARRLNDVVDPIATTNELAYLKTQRDFPEEFGENDLATQLHILYSLINWLNFYGERGHGYEADY
ncbi:hypothetical protein [Pedobacter sp. UBA5917]|jgi:hypothetical protein|uniref:hypothetical protein n=1 Tax=Pedobacter sp. UBA5917 TaxID=1947061 RepID=UPI0025FCB479|nr:hypothetical protein [Pedobacter sp. UBA5917]